MSQNDRMNEKDGKDESGVTSGEGSAQHFRGWARGAPDSGGTGGSTRLRLLFGHEPSDHEEDVVIMGFFILERGGSVKNVTGSAAGLRYVRTAHE